MVDDSYGHLDVDAPTHRAAVTLKVKPRLIFDVAAAYGFALWAGKPANRLLPAV
ncbi:hypothetical protein [Variovorax sp. GB1P17]|uniref:hypothetical protein n=1 Tax=Variovorax sp. GB1P17 TaxID=3443740 RepID=UPI003F48319D